MITVLTAPEFITFTGVDDLTDLDAMAALAERYPIEWGVLLSPSRQGIDTRFPSMATVERLATSGLTLSAHLCGDHSRAIMEGAMPSLDRLDIGAFSRFQINSGRPDVDRICAFQAMVVKPCIAQSRTDAFPDDLSVQWLFDRSGGRGEAQDHWPTYPGRFVGYAGGLNPANVMEALDAIRPSGPYWIDMESGVRLRRSSAADDRFDLDRCRQVCEAVYGR